MADSSTAAGPEWDKQERTALVVKILRGAVSLEDAARQNDLSVAQIESWRDEFLAEAEAAALTGGQNDTAGASASPREYGVWVCAPGRDSIAPVLFMQAVCGDEFPLAATAEWTGSSGGHRSKSESVPLLRGRWSRAPQPGPRVSLFTTKVTDTARFEGKGGLSEWRLPLPIMGIVALIEYRAGYGPSGRGPVLSRRGGLQWAVAQGVPLVVGAVGLEAADGSIDEVRASYGLPRGAAVLAGPPLARPRSRPRAGGLLGRLTVPALLGAGDLSFDADYAAQLLLRLL